MRKNHDFFTTVGRASTAEFSEKNSRFIGHIKPIKEEDDALDFIKEIKKKYYDATHNVYAYLLPDGTSARFSDDGEPRGTAGLPVLEVIKKSGVCGVVIVVTRYFGGTMLGAGGLVRAYGKSAHMAIEAAGIVKYEKFDVFELVCGYADYQKCEYLFPDFGTIVDRVDFSEMVRLELAVSQARSAEFQKKITEAGNGRNVLKKVGERFDVLQP